MVIKETVLKEVITMDKGVARFHIWYNMVLLGVALTVIVAGF